MLEKTMIELYHEIVRRFCMKCKLIINKEHEEEVLIYAHRRTRLTDEIEKLVADGSKEIIGYIEREAYKLSFAEITCFVVEDNNVYALTDKGKLRLRLRLYQIEKIIDGSFIKINQSCIANIKEMKKFNATISGTLTVTYKNGYSEDVSRRNIKKVKERLGV